MPSFMLLVPVCLRMDRASCHSAASTAGRERATALQPAIGQGSVRPQPRPWCRKLPLTSFQIAWEIISSSCTLPNVFYCSVIHWLSLSISSPPLKISPFFSQGIQRVFKKYPIFVYHIVPCKGKIQAVRNFLHSLTWTCEQGKDCLFLQLFWTRPFQLASNWDVN